MNNAVGFDAGHQQLQRCNMFAMVFYQATTQLCQIRRSDQLSSDQALEALLPASNQVPLPQHTNSSAPEDPQSPTPTTQSHPPTALAFTGGTSPPPFTGGTSQPPYTRPLETPRAAAEGAPPAPPTPLQPPAPQTPLRPGRAAGSTGAPVGGLIEWGVQGRKRAGALWRLRVWLRVSGAQQWLCTREKFEPLTVPGHASRTPCQPAER